jgi:XRE family transcriptional regulator, regulator of sulfur utilization
MQQFWPAGTEPIHPVTAYCAMPSRTRTAAVSSKTSPKPRSSARPTVSGGDDLGAAELARRVADSLRTLRAERRLSLDQLAVASGVSRAALSQIEGARTNPTLGVLWKIASGLGVPFQMLLGTGGGGKCRLLRASDVAPLRSTDGRVESRLLSPAGATVGIEVYELRFQPKGVQQSEAHASGTSETVLLLTGALRVTVDDETHDLTPGDSIYFRADVVHSYSNQSSHEARCIDIITYGRGI